MVTLAPIDLVVGNCVISTPGVGTPLLRLPPSGSNPGKSVNVNKSRP